MKGLDTNVLVRYLTADDPVQTPVARTLLETAEDRGERFHISTVALCELAWTLRGQPYRLDRSAIADVLERILGTSLFEVQERDLIRRSLAEYRRGKADFPDDLIGWQNRQAGCDETITFDGKLANTGGFSVLLHAG